MKLRNKKTGEILGSLGSFIIQNPNHINCEAITKYESLAELNADWEDYKENEYYYAITSIKADDGITKMKNIHNDMTDFDKSIGNCFETKEEAVAAVEKLKAYKRLKDKGFKFFGVKGLDYAIDFDIKPPFTHIHFDEYTASEDQKEFYNDLMLLFGGDNEQD